MKLSKLKLIIKTLKQATNCNVVAIDKQWVFCMNDQGIACIKNRYGYLYF